MLEERDRNLGFALSVLWCGYGPTVYVLKRDGKDMVAGTCTVITAYLNGYCDGCRLALAQ